MSRTSRAFTAVLIVLASAVITSCGGASTSKELVGYQLTPATNVADLSLPEAGAADDFAFKAPPGHLLLTYFGYTSCPDVCPTTLAAVRSALRTLDDRADKIDLAMVTIDPERDTDQVLPGYVRSFVPDAHALRTDDDRVLRSVADRFGASYSVTPGANGTPEVAHSGALYVVDPNGKILLTWPFGVKPKDMANDLQILLDGQR